MGLENVRRHPFYLFYLCVLSGLLLLGGLILSFFSRGFSYGDPEFLALEKQLQSPLIEAVTLQSWIDDGNKHPFGYPVVVVDTSATGYEEGHIPGALSIPWTEFSEVRNDGPALVDSMVAGGSHIDELLKRMGIRNQETLVVFTSNEPQTGYTVTRAFWALYYWGFKPRYIKILNGGNQGYAKAGFSLTKESYSPGPGTFSVRNLNNPNQMDESRKSIGDMIRLVDEGKTQDGSVQVLYVLPPDVRLPGSRERIKLNDFNALSVYFSGKIQGATQLMFDEKNLFQPDGTLKTKQEILELFTGIGLDPGKPTIVYCNRGNMASLYWFALKFVAGFKDLAVYDGSWSEWGKLLAYQPTPQAPYVLKDGVAEAFLQGYDPQRRVFLDSLGKEQTVPNAFLIPGGVLEGHTDWDTLTRSEFVVFNPEAIQPAALPEPYATSPDYLGNGDEIENEDRNYLLAGGGITQGPQEPTPTAIQPIMGAGGGC